MMGRRRAVLRPISTSPITMNTLSNIEQGIVSDILRPTSASFIITPTISYLVGRVACMLPISNSPITSNSIFCILRGKLDGIFIPISMSTIINYDITLLY